MRAVVLDCGGGLHMDFVGGEVGDVGDHGCGGVGGGRGGGGSGDVRRGGSLRMSRGKAQMAVVEGVVNALRIRMEFMMMMILIVVDGHVVAPSALLLHSFDIEMNCRTTYTSGEGARACGPVKKQ